MGNLTEREYLQRKAEIERGLLDAAQEHRDASYRHAIGTGDLAAVEAAEAKQKSLHTQLGALRAAWGVAVEVDDRQERLERAEDYAAGLARLNSMFDERDRAARDFAKGCALIAKSAAELRKSGEEIRGVAIGLLMKVPPHARRGDTQSGWSIRDAVDMGSIAQAIGRMLWDAGIRFRTKDFSMIPARDLGDLAEHSRSTVMGILEGYAPEELEEAA